MCGQCTRLGHNCDYIPRLSFRDDTQRVVERMQEVSIVGNSIWDCQSSPIYTRIWLTIAATSPAPTEGSFDSGGDDLPPFAQLATDEDREKKAVLSSPGTYHVVVNPDSFQHLPEYSDDPEIKKEKHVPLRRPSIATSLASSLGREAPSLNGPVPGDPNTVVLPKFEDVLRRTATKDRSPPSPILSKIKTEESDLANDVQEHESTDDRYLRQFRQVVWKQVVPAEIEHVDGMEHSSAAIMESEASFFPPVSLSIILKEVD